MDPPSFFKLLTESCVTWQKCVFTFQPLSSTCTGSKGGSHLLNTKRRVSTHISMWEHSYQKQTHRVWDEELALLCVVFLFLIFQSSYLQGSFCFWCFSVLNSQNRGEVSKKEFHWMSLIWQLQLSWCAQLVTETFAGHLRTKQRHNSQVRACVCCAQRNTSTSCVRCKYPACQFHTLSENPFNCAPCVETAKVGSHC